MLCTLWLYGGVKNQENYVKGMRVGPNELGQNVYVNYHESNLVMISDNSTVM